MRLVRYAIPAAALAAAALGALTTCAGDEPSATASPASLSFTATAGGAAPEPQLLVLTATDERIDQFELQLEGGDPGRLAWSYVCPAPPGHDRSCGPMDPADRHLYARWSLGPRSTDLPPGQRHTRLRIVARDWDGNPIGGPVTVNVTYTLRPAG